MIVLAPGAIEVARKRAAGESQGARIEVIERLLLNRVAGERRDCAVDQRHQLAILVTAGPAPTQPTRRDLTPAFAGQAADPPAGWLLGQAPRSPLGSRDGHAQDRLLKQSLSDELFRKRLTEITRHGGAIGISRSAGSDSLGDSLILGHRVGSYAKEPEHRSVSC